MCGFNFSLFFLVLIVEYKFNSFLSYEPVYDFSLESNDTAKSFTVIESFFYWAGLTDCVTGMLLLVFEHYYLP